ncbi:DUF6343 family protein [Streptomyces sp. L2]|uniref:DUF6343 family protein n=1 Tax=Streptomyces sp. L2 TaxID=2162665 RepID=UPI001013A282|nr:DUF6343 family protein [Streptomyces sp. L2]
MKRADHVNGTSGSGHRRARSGTEPVVARSALGLRMALSGFFFPLFAAASAGFGVWASGSTPEDHPSDDSLWWVCGICGVLALVAAVDLVVLARRRKREKTRPRPYASDVR